MMRYQPDMLEFIQGKCEVVMEPRKFVHDWIATKRNPCSVCSKDKSLCSFYKELVSKGAVGEEENQS
jgi:hypothetical protein